MLLSFWIPLMRKYKKVLVKILPYVLKHVMYFAFSLSVHFVIFKDSKHNYILYPIFRNIYLKQDFPGYHI